MTKKLFFAAFILETNTFSPIPTTVDSFEEATLVRPGNRNTRNDEMLDMIRGGIGDVLDKGSSWEVVEGTIAIAQPAGLIVKKDYETLRDEILGQLLAIGPVDAVVFALHGAMMAYGYDDCEGDLLTRARRIAGRDTPVGVFLDPHCHMSTTMIDESDLIVIMKEYPHIDVFETINKTVELTIQMAEKLIVPHIAVFDCRQITLYHTTRDPMRSFVDRIKALEGSDGVLSISVVHGFPWGDNPDLGSKLLVTTNNDPAAGNELARELGMELMAERENCRAEYLPVDDGLKRARQVDSGPVVIADVSDNPGGGAGGDSTLLLENMLCQGMTDACMACLWDPVAVRFCTQVGEGAVLNLRLGGKVGRFSHKPLDLKVTVLKIQTNARDIFGGLPCELGTLVGLRTEAGLELVISDFREQVRGLGVFTNVGIDPSARRYVVVKSAQHFYDAFAPIAGEVIYIDAPGALVSDLSLLDYKQRPHPLWPFEDTA